MSKTIQDVHQSYSKTVVKDSIRDLSKKVYNSCLRKSRAKCASIHLSRSIGALGHPQLLVSPVGQKRKVYFEFECDPYQPYLFFLFDIKKRMIQQKNNFEKFP